MGPNRIPPKKRGPGGAGPGRNPNWFKDRCAQMVDKHDLVEFLGRVASGKEQETKVTREGDVIQVNASIYDRLRATEMLMDRGFGKPSQALEVGGEGGGPVKWTLEIVTRNA